jgi:hypothetical protein
MFDRPIAESPEMREAIDRVVEEQLEEQEAAAQRRPHAGQEVVS